MSAQHTPHRALPAEAYDDQWSRLDDFTRYNPGARHRRRLIAAALGAIPVRPSTVLDVGCGLGEVVRYLQPLLPSATFSGIDLSPLAIEECRRALPGGRWEVLDLTDGPLDEVVDLVLCSEVLEHLDDPRSGAANLAAMVSSGGHLLVTVPAGPVFETERMIGHVEHPTVPQVHGWLEDAGLVPVWTRCWGWPGYKALKRLGNIRPQATMDRLGSGTYSRPVRWANAIAYAGTLLTSLPQSRLGVQTVVVARKDS